MPAFELPLSSEARSSLAIGVLALLIWAVAFQIPALLRRILASHDRPQRWVSSAVWSLVGRMLMVVYAIGFLYLTLRLAYLDPVHVGLVPLAWEELVGWLPAVAGFTALWTALLWGAYWRRVRPASDHSPAATYGTFLGLPAHLVGEEAWAAILRGTLVPALGLYWGAWGAALVRVLASLLGPGARHRLRNDTMRPFVYLDWAMEGLAAGCFAITGSLWASLIARATGHLAANLAHRGLYLWAHHRERRRVRAETG
jgi:hypothetical protein